MNTYKNKQTGAVITTPCECRGGDWEPVKAPAPQPKKNTRTKGAQK